MFENVALTIHIFVPVGARSSPKKKVKPNEEKEDKKEKRKKKEKGKEIRMLYSKKQISVLTGLFSECMAKSIWLAYV